MSRRDDRTTLRQMLDHLEEAIALSEGRSQPEFESNRMLYFAMLKLVEIVGEAATRLSESLRAAHPEIPWREIIGTRNRLIHGYDSVDCSILWDIVTGDFPPLAAQIKAVIRSEKRLP